jgi:lipopolysaccharide transport system permease protein
LKVRDFITLVDTKAKMTIKAESSRLYLSFLWWIVEPLFFVATFYVVFEVLLGYGQKDYIIFLMCAKIPYLWFSKAVTSAAGSIMADKWVVSYIDIPKAIFPYSAIQISIYKEAVVFFLLIALCFSYGYHPHLNWIYLLPLIFLEYIIIVFFGLLTAVLVCYAEDVRILINMFMLLLMFISGIFFDVATIKAPFGELLLAFNPIAFLCNGFRSILMNNGVYNMHLFLYYLCFFLLGVVFMHVFYAKFNRSISAKVVNS